MKSWRSPRRHWVTDEPQPVEPSLIGARLATFRRRATAFAFDLALFVVSYILLLVSLTAFNFHREDPSLIPNLMASRRMEKGPERVAATQQAAFSFWRMVHRRDPTILDSELAAALASGEVDRFWEALVADEAQIVIAGDRTTAITMVNGRKQIVLGTDLLLGDLNMPLTWAGAFVCWFTLLTRLGRGRTPGKWLLRMRVVRLDGRKLSFWNAFERAGGYGASAATLSLGFLEAIWHPNRQTLHDRVAGTVVVRG